MMQYLLPPLPDTLYKYICLQQDETQIPISNSLSYYLNDIKENIKICADTLIVRKSPTQNEWTRSNRIRLEWRERHEGHEECTKYRNKYSRTRRQNHPINQIGGWDSYKKLTNPYEFIHTSFPREGGLKSGCVALHRPLSRSYFKMIELIQEFDLHVSMPTPLRTFHLAEGPGGFIEALVERRRTMGKKCDIHHGMTLIRREEIAEVNTDIPGWNKAHGFLHANQHVFIETGLDNTGNIMSIDNFVHIVSKYGSTMDMITADGGFDFSPDYNNQEKNAADLIFGQIAYAVCMQRLGGSFVLKIFDTFTKYTTDMISLLASMYQSVHITKPLTSRHANSERYLVCRGFKFSDISLFYSFIYDAFVSILQLPHINNRCILHKKHISCIFMSKIEECNAIFGEQQIENIHQTIQMIQNDVKTVASTQSRHCGHNDDDILLRHPSIISKHIHQCIVWCKKHDIQYDVTLDKL